MSFVHLHNHTEYSLLDGASRISKLVKIAKEQGAPAVAITDHGNMYGTYKFYKECKKIGVKAIIGCEVYIVDDLNTKVPTEHRAHLVLLAKNNEGYINLCKINSKAWVDGFYYKPRIDYNFLKEHSEGLICLSACLAGHIPHYLMLNQYDEAKKYAVTLKNIFGEDFYIELQDHGMPEQRAVNPQLIALANELSIELVATNDMHYLYKEDADMQDALMCVTLRTTVDDPDRGMRFPSSEFYYKSRAEMEEIFGKTAPSALDNTLKIAEKCNCHPFEKQDLIPQFDTPNGEDNVEYFKSLIDKGLRAKYKEITPQIIERYETEFSVIHSQHFVDYFLIVADFMRYANENGIAVGPGRGSGAGSLIAYALDITKIDPLKYNLLFERFLHGERVSMPDFDLDFCCNRREEVINYVINKYGADRVCQIVTFGTMAAKAAIKDIARVFRMPYAEVEAITKPMNFGQAVRPPMLPYVFGLKKLKNPRDLPDFDTMPEKDKQQLLDTYKKENDKLNLLRSPELINMYKNNEFVKKVVDMALKVEGFPRNCSTHAAGVIICKKVVGDVTPLQRNGPDITSQFDMKEIEQLGMLKMDFLGLITLTDIQGALADIKSQLGVDIDFYNMEYNDANVYKMIASGDTDAVFQLESGGFKRFMKELQPDCIEDIIAGVALFRPGPMDMIHSYCRNKHNPELTTYEHPLLEPILRNTYGQIVYQEQVMDIFKAIGGYSLGQADMVRRAMGKKDVKEMERQRDIFISGDPKINIKGAVANGVSREIALALFEKMQKFAGYAFNKSHATCYAFIAYQTAYLKHYYYPFYMASVLNNRVHKWDDMTRYIVSIRSQNVEVLPPDINKSQTFFTVSDGAIRFGLGALKNIGIGVIDGILNERKSGGDFKSFEDFCRRVTGAALGKKCLESLILSGAFDSLGHTRSGLMSIYPTYTKHFEAEKKITDSGQLSLFQTTLKTDENCAIKIPSVPEFDTDTKLKFEKEVVGMYLSGHPLQQYAKLFEECNFNTSYIGKNSEDGEAVINEELEDGRVQFENNSSVTIGAIITDVKKLLTKATKKDMAVLTIEDLFGSCEVLIFPQTYDKIKNILAVDAVIKVYGRLSLREGETVTILADNIELLKNTPSQAFTEQVTDVKRQEKLYLRYNTADTQLQNEVLKVLQSYSGDLSVVIKCIATNGLFSPTIKVRKCDAIRYELASLVGEENVIIK